MAVKVLFLSANAQRAIAAVQRDVPPETGDPKDLRWLDIDREYNRVQEALDFPGLDGRHVIEMIPHIQWDQFARILQDSRFKFILHFSGHGDANGGLYMKSEEGTPEAISRDKLVETIRRYKHRIALVVFNACYSADVAKVLVNDIGVVIGMEKEVSDRAAITFSKRFYQRLVYRGDTIQEAFDQAHDLVGVARIVKRDDKAAAMPLFDPLRDRTSDEDLRRMLQLILAPLVPDHRASIQPHERETLILKLSTIEAATNAVLNAMDYLPSLSLPPQFSQLRESVDDVLKRAKSIREVLVASQAVSTLNLLSGVRG